MFSSLWISTWVKKNWLLCRTRHMWRWWRGALVCIRAWGNPGYILHIFVFSRLKHNSRSNLTSHLTTLPNQAHWQRVSRVTPADNWVWNPGPFWAPRMGYTSEPRLQGSNPVDIYWIFRTEINNKRSAKWSIYKRAAV
jgi:hypothetical protein